MGFPKLNKKKEVNCRESMRQSKKVKTAGDTFPKLYVTKTKTKGRISYILELNDDNGGIKDIFRQS